jgi:hypothetical protein
MAQSAVLVSLGNAALELARLSTISHPQLSGYPQGIHID